MLDDRSRTVESWTWFAIASLVTICRFVSRSIRLGGWRYLELEDLFMVLTFGFYTNVIVWVNIQEKHPQTNILPPTGTAGLSTANLNDRIYGSKITFTIEESMVMTQFLCKVCMCLLYRKLTTGLREQVRVHILLSYVVAGWVVTEIFFFGVWCRPFLNYFRVIDNNTGGCTTSQHHLIMSYAFNLSSDLLMLAVPIPILIKSKLPGRQKASICAIFSLGIFVIICATLNRYYCFAHPESILWIYWYVREASTAVIVTNAPHCYVLLRMAFDFSEFGSIVSGILPKCSKQSTDHTDPNSLELNKHGKGSDRNLRLKKDASESTENFATRSEPPLEIWQHSEYSVRGHDASEVQWDESESRTIWSGGLGTKSTVVSGTASHDADNKV